MLAGDYVKALNHIINMEKNGHKLDKGPFKQKCCRYCSAVAFTVAWRIKFSAYCATSNMVEAAIIRRDMNENGDDFFEIQPQTHNSQGFK